MGRISAGLTGRGRKFASPRPLARFPAVARTPQEQEMLLREIEATDGQINRLVYGLYELTEEEVRIVEGG